MANAGCINAIGFDGCFIQTLQNLDSACIGVGVQFTAPNPLDDKRFDYIKYTDKCGNTCCLTGENEILIYATNGTIKNLTLTNDDANEVVNVKRNDIFGSNWKKTVVRYKTGGYPTSITDGTLAVEETTMNQYQSSGYNVSGLSDATTYYFTAFAVAQDDTIIVVQSNSITTEFRLPSTYQEVEYIQSTGNQLIDSGYSYGGGYMKIEAKILFNSFSVGSGDTPFIYGVIGRTYGNYYLARRSSGQSIAPNKFEFGTGTSYNTSITVQTSTIYDTMLEYNSGTMNMNINGTAFSSSSTGIMYQGHSLPIFCRRDIQESGNGYQYFAQNMRLYSFNIYSSSDNLARQFIPCYRKSDSVIGLRDRIGKQFYTNQGTGSFTKGPNV